MGLIAGYAAPTEAELAALQGATLENLHGEYLSRDLRQYVPRAWQQSMPTTPFVHNWHHDAVAEHLMAVSLGQIRFLLISEPPRHTKSWETCVFWPSWHWTRWPSTQWMFVSYSKDFAVRDSGATRRLIDTPWYQARWGCACEERPHARWCNSFRWTTDQNVKEFYENDRGGRRLTAGVEAGTTGHGYDIGVFDDPIDIKKAASDAIREAAKKYIDQVFLGRMNDPGSSKVVGIAQRTHFDDPTGHLLRESPLPWVHLRIPTEYQPKVQVDFREVSPLGWKDPRKEDRELLWPARFTRAIVEAKKLTLGPYAYSAQEQQEPSPLEGGILRREWWRFYIPRGLSPETRAQLMVPIRSKDGIEYPPAIELPEFRTQQEGGRDELLISLDASFKDEAGQIRKGQAPDPISLGAWGRKGSLCFLLDLVNHRADIEATIADLERMAARFPGAVRKVIEDKANGPAIMAILRRRIGGIVPATPTASKVARVMTAGTSDKDRDARAMSMVALLAAHNVYLLHPAIAPYIWEYIEEHAAFPNGAHDDNVDMTSQALAALQPWMWREADKAQGEVLAHANEPAISDTRELLRRRVLEASGMEQARQQTEKRPRRPFRDPYRRRGR